MKILILGGQFMRSSSLAMLRDQTDRWFPAAVVVAAVATLWPAVTRGESSALPACYEPAIFAPGADATIPANAPALLFRSPNAFLLRPLADFKIEVRALSTGAVIPLTSQSDPDDATGRTFLFRSSAPLVPGRHQWEYIDYCVGPSPGTPTPATVAFAVGPEAPFPLTIGMPAAPEMTVHPGQQCVSEDSVTTILKVVPSPEMAAYLAVTRFSLSVPTRPAQYGDQVSNPIQFWLYTHCQTGAAGSLDFIPNGPSQIEIRAHIAGAAIDPPPLVVDVLVECPGPDLAVPPCVRDAGMDTVTTPVPPVPRDASGTTTSGKGGCAVAGTPMDTPSGAVAFLAIVLATVLRGRRSR